LNNDSGIALGGEEIAGMDKAVAMRSPVRARPSRVLPERAPPPPIAPTALKKS
jgi:hypothetical protein